MPDPPIREPDEIRQSCSKKLRDVEVSPHFQAILGCLLGEDWTTPRLVEMVITPDGHLLGRTEMQTSLATFLGSSADLIRNIHGTASARWPNLMATRPAVSWREWLRSKGGVEFMAKQGPLRLPVVSSGAEYLVMGYLMRRNILAYKAPEHNEGFDLICIHPDPRYVPKEGELAQVRVQVKSRYATDCDRSFPIREASIDAFDYLIVVFQNIGNFFGRFDGSEGEREPEFFTLPREFVQEHHDTTSTWQRVKLRRLASKIEPYKNGQGFELIARRLGVVRPMKMRDKTSGPNVFSKTPIE